jgi:beta-glucanase (GH16 family)
VQRPKAGRHERIRAKIALTMDREPTHASDITIVVSKSGTGGVVTPSSVTRQPVGIPGNWNLVLDSEFKGRSLDTSIWRTGWFGSGVTVPGNVTFPGDGTMHLNVTAVPSTCGGVTMPYTGAMVSTNPNDGRTGGGFQYTYGVLEARVYVPDDGDLVANWPAVWTDGQPSPTRVENDVFEGLGWARASLHDAVGTASFSDVNLTPGWHTFASDWEPGSVTYYYDGLPIGSATNGISSAPMYIVLDNSVHSNWPQDTEADSLQVQYVRVWQH